MFPPGTLNLGFSATASHYIGENQHDRQPRPHGWRPGQRIGRLCRAGPGGLGKHAVEPGKRFGRRRKLALFNFGSTKKDVTSAQPAASACLIRSTSFGPRYGRRHDHDRRVLEHKFSTSYRTVEQFTAPSSKRRPVYKAGLRMEHVETRVVECPYEVDFRSHGDAEKFAREYIPTLRSWAERPLRSLSAERSPEECQEILDRYFDNYEQRVREHPTGHAMDYVHCYLIVEKV